MYETNVVDWRDRMDISDSDIIPSHHQMTLRNWTSNGCPRQCKADGTKIIDMGDRWDPGSSPINSSTFRSKKSK